MKRKQKSHQETPNTWFDKCKHVISNKENSRKRFLLVLMRSKTSSFFVALQISEMWSKIPRGKINVSWSKNAHIKSYVITIIFETEFQSLFAKVQTLWLLTIVCLCDVHQNKTLRISSEIRKTSYVWNISVKDHHISGDNIAYEVLIDMWYFI